MEQALAALTANGRSKTEAVRYALLRTCGDELVKRAREDAERSAAETDDRAELLAIERYPGTGRS